MSKKEKLRKRLYKIPSPKDFHWDELITLMRQANFSENCIGGSHYMFEHVSGYRFRASKTHPSGLLKKYQINDAKTALDAINFGETDE